MRTGIKVDVTAADRARLDAVVANRNSPQKHGKRPVSPVLRGVVQVLETGAVNGVLLEGSRRRIGFADRDYHAAPEVERVGEGGVAG